MKCISCSKDTSEGTKFHCPKCKREIFRCERCRSLSIDYKCNCDFVGP